MTPQPEPLSTKATIESFSVGARHYELRMNDCGKINCRKCGGTGQRHPSHGPYWYLCVLARGAWRRIYLGKELDTTKFVGDDGKVDWAAVKEKRVRKTYVETTVHDVPGQISMIPEVPDLALEIKQPSPIPSPGDPRWDPAPDAPDLAADPRAAPKLDHNPDPTDLIVKGQGEPLS